MKVSDLNPGMLLEPSDEFLWAEIPWRGTDGSIIANYLVVVSGEEDVEEFEMVRKEPVLYLGTNSQTITASTPGNQVVLAWGKKMTVDPYSWAKIEPHCTK